MNLRDDWIILPKMEKSFVLHKIIYKSRRNGREKHFNSTYLLFSIHESEGKSNPISPRLFLYNGKIKENDRFLL